MAPRIQRLVLKRSFGMGSFADSSPPTAMAPSARPAKLTAVERRRLEVEAEREVQTRRTLAMDVLSTQLASKLFSLGHICRDLDRSCCENLGWSIQDWQKILKQGKVLVWEPSTALHAPAEQASRSGKRKSINGAQSWPEETQVTALSLLIMRSGGTRVEFQTASFSNQRRVWGHITHHSELRCIFVHRNQVEGFLGSHDSSMVDLVQSVPRIQIFEFGNSNLASFQLNPGIDLMFSGGALIFATVDALFLPSPTEDDEHQPYHKRLSQLDRINPLIKVLLFPSLQKRLLWSQEEDLQTDSEDSSPKLLLDCITTRRFQDTVPTKDKSLAEVIRMPHPPLDWVNHPEVQVFNEAEEEKLEVEHLGDLMSLVRKKMYRDFRRFFIAVSSESVAVQALLAPGVECTEIRQLCEILRTEPF